MGAAAMGTSRCTCTASKTSKEIRAALIRLLWRSVADQDCCDDRAECEADPLDICVAMQALGWGKHWDSKTFERKFAAMVKKRRTA